MTLTDKQSKRFAIVSIALHRTVLHSIQCAVDECVSQAVDVAWWMWHDSDNDDDSARVCTHAMCALAIAIARSTNEFRLCARLDSARVHKPIVPLHFRFRVRYAKSTACLSVSSRGVFYYKHFCLTVFQRKKFTVRKQKKIECSSTRVKVTRFSFRFVCQCCLLYVRVCVCAQWPAVLSAKLYVIKLALLDFALRFAKHSKTGNENEYWAAAKISSQFTNLNRSVTRRNWKWFALNNVLLKLNTNYYFSVK